MRALVLSFLLPALALGASVNGRITDPGGAGLSGMEVRLWGLTAKGFTFQSPTGRTTLSDASGNYAFAAVPAGSYRLDVRMPNGFSGNWGDRWYDVEQPSASGYSPDDDDVLVLTAASALTGMNISVQLFGGFDGRAVDGSSQPQIGFWRARRTWLIAAFTTTT